jgi:hypothetical protein
MTSPVISLYDLPNEILLNIFNNADSDKSLYRVCRRFHKLILYKNRYKIRELTMGKNRVVSF